MTEPSVASIVDNCHTYLSATTPAPNLNSSFSNIDKYLTVRGLQLHRAGMPLLIVHPLQAVSAAETYGQWRLTVQMAFDVCKSLTNPVKDDDQSDVVALAQLVLEKLRADHTWADNVVGGGISISGGFVDPELEGLADDSSRILVWRWTTDGMDIA
tara:strand:+ start:2970 stop:3437 length:468 start_codon:yes stop_codon:yes gene_type:complete